MFTVSFNIVESINRLRTQEIVYIYPSLVSSDGNIRTAFSPLCISGKKRYKVVARKERLGGNPGTLLPVKDIRSSKDLREPGISVKEALPLNVGWLPAISFFVKRCMDVPSAVKV